jgi:uncharacterized protein (TIGR02597 family)
MTYTFPATTQVTTTYISIPLTNPAVYTGPVASLTANTITFGGTPFTAGELAQTGSPFFARIATGPQAGRTMLVTGNTANSITVDTTDNSSQTTPLNLTGWSVAEGNRIEIIVGDTLASMFGNDTPSNPLKFVKGTLFGSDKIGFYNKTNGKYDAFYFSTSSKRWVSTLNANFIADNIIIYPESVIQITQRPSRPITSITFIGDIPSVAPAIKTVGANTDLHTAFRFPIDIKLADLKFGNWTKGNTLFAQSDRLGILNVSNGKFDSYFQRTDGTWRSAQDVNTDRSNTVIKAGSVITLLKKATVSGSSSFILKEIPYNLN